MWNGSSCNTVAAVILAWLAKRIWGEAMHAIWLLLVDYAWIDMLLRLDGQS
jgi:hypothetical protein